MPLSGIDLELVLLRALAKKPEERQPTMRRFRDELLACIDASHWRPIDAERWWADHHTMRDQPMTAITTRMDAPRVVAIITPG